MNVVSQHPAQTQTPQLPLDCPPRPPAAGGPVAMQPRVLSWRSRHKLDTTKPRWVGNPGKVPRHQSNEVLELPPRMEAEALFAFWRMELHHPRTQSHDCQEEQGPSSQQVRVLGGPRIKPTNLCSAAFHSVTRLEPMRDIVPAFVNIEIMWKN